MDLFVDIDIKTDIVINKTKLYTLLNQEINNYIKNNKDINLKLIKLYFNFIENKGHIIHTYHHRNDDKIGRVYPSNGSLLYLDKNSRNYLCDSEFIDYDIVNCHFVILYNMCKLYSLSSSFENLKTYVDHRDECINDIVISNTNVSKEHVKMVFIEILNGGKMNFNELSNKTQFIINFNEELKIIRNELYDKLKKYDSYYFNKIYNKDFYRKSRNIKTKILFQYYQSYENHILKYLINYFNKYYESKQMTLMFDGLLIKGTAKNINLDDISSFITDNIGFTNIVVKSKIITSDNTNIIEDNLNYDEIDDIITYYKNSDILTPIDTCFYKCYN